MPYIGFAVRFVPFEKEQLLDEQKRPKLVCMGVISSNRFYALKRVKWTRSLVFFRSNNRLPAKKRTINY